MNCMLNHHAEHMPTCCTKINLSSCFNCHDLFVTIVCWVNV